MRRVAFAALQLAALGGMVASCSSGTTQSGSYIFGALLPFTGEQAAIGANVERTLFMAVDAVNKGGGVQGKQVAVKTVDSHSDPERGRVDAQKLLSLPELRAVVGPEEPDLAAALRPDLAARSIVDFLPGVATPPRDASVLGEFRVGPSAPVIAGALAELMHADGVQRLGIVYEPGSYGEQVSSLTRCEFTAQGGNDPVVVAITPDGSVDDAFRQLIASPPDAILLIAYPKSGAKVVLNWTVSHVGPTKWYLAPTLDVDEFVDNVIPGSLDNATGISASKQTYAGAFDTEFNARWFDFPMTVAYYYYDSLAVLSLAIEASQNKGTPLGDEIVAVSSLPGETIAWNDLARGLMLARQGVDINYEGLTGNVDVDPNRDVRQSLLRNFWVVAGKIKHSSLPFDYSQFLTTQCANQ